LHSPPETLRRLVIKPPHPDLRRDHRDNADDDVDAETWALQ
jgi:hypothetical protein